MGVKGAPKPWEGGKEEKSKTERQTHCTCEPWGWMSASKHVSRGTPQAGNAGGMWHPAAQGCSWGCGNAVPWCSSSGECQ